MITYEEYRKEKPFIEKEYKDLSDELFDFLLSTQDWPETDGYETALFLKQHDMKCNEESK